MGVEGRAVADGARVGVAVGADVGTSDAVGVCVAEGASVAVRVAVAVRVGLGVRVELAVRVGVGLAAMHWTVLPFNSRRVVQPVMVRLSPGRSVTTRTAKASDKAVRKCRYVMDALSKISEGDALVFTHVGCKALQDNPIWRPSSSGITHLLSH